MTTEFNDLNLHPQLVQAVADRGYTTPTPIQEGIIPLMLEGHDVLGQAQTGTGKTAAFSLPILHKITPGLGHVQALVLAPTRELAMQVAHTAHEYGKLRGIKILSIYGGQPYGRQINRLRKGVDMVAGTPGRVLDLIQRNALDLSQVSTVVLDEADEMLSMGFIEDIESILKATPTDRQTALFSATLPPQIRRLAKDYLRDPKSVTIQNKQMTVDTIEQRYYLVNESDKLNALTRLFEIEEINTALIFARTRVGTGELANELSIRNYPAESLNGDLSQDAREQVLSRFRRGQIKVLVATDVAARGLDIDDISHVFNFDLPQDPEIYVHRVGRTGRAGRSGVAITLLTPQEQHRLRRIESFSRHRLEKFELPTEEEIHAHRADQLLEKMGVWLRRGRCTQEREMVAQLMEQGHDIAEIAASALKLARSEEKQRPIATIQPLRTGGSRSGRGRGDRFERRGGGFDRRGRGNRRESFESRQSNGGNGANQDGRRSREAGMVRLEINAGKHDGVRPGDVVGTIAYHADIPGSTIGAIRIQDSRTLVDLPQEYVDKVLEKSGSYQIHRQAVTVSVA